MSMPARLRAALLAVSMTLATATTAAAQDEGRDVMVVLDASGSMWGQIDGISKIEIARDTFGVLSQDWQALGVRAGLIAYGHRRRGDCSDIELISEPSVAAAGAMGAAVRGLTPLGKTPITDALRRAASVLRSTEDAATVVLLSDGRETCEADPCAAAAELEAAGIDFTVHVIGFDIEAAEDVAQLRCIADATGGRYFDAADAGALTQALGEVVTAPANMPDPDAPVAITLRALLPDGTAAPGGADWSLIRDGAADLMAPQTPISSGSFDLPPGDWTVSVALETALGPAEGQRRITVDGPATFDIPVAYLAPDAGLTLASRAHHGEYVIFDVALTGIGSDDRIRIVPRGGSDAQEVDSAAAAPEVAILATMEPGAYDAIYVADAYGLRDERARIALDIAPQRLEVVEIAPVVAGAPGTLRLDLLRFGDDVLRFIDDSGVELGSMYLTESPFGVPASLPAGPYDVVLHRNYAIRLDLGRIDVLPEGSAPVGEDSPPPGATTTLDEGNGRTGDTPSLAWEDHALTCLDGVSTTCNLVHEDSGLSVVLPQGWVVSRPERGAVSAGLSDAGGDSPLIHATFFEAGGDLRSYVLNPAPGTPGLSRCLATRAGMLCTDASPDRDIDWTLGAFTTQGSVGRRCGEEGCDWTWGSWIEVSLPSLWSAETPRVLPDGRIATFLFDFAPVGGFQLLGLNQQDLLGSGADCRETPLGTLCRYAGQTDPQEFDRIAHTLGPGPRTQEQGGLTEAGIGAILDRIAPDRQPAATE